jgi:hypothetical protein
LVLAICHTIGQAVCPGRIAVAAHYNRAQIQAALAMNDPATSAYLDLETGHVVYINETDTDPTIEELREAIMAAYGDRYRYVPGGNSAADDAAVTAWLEAEGL